MILIVNLTHGPAIQTAVCPPSPVLVCVALNAPLQYKNSNFLTPKKLILYIHIYIHRSGAVCRYTWYDRQSGFPKKPILAGLIWEKMYKIMHGTFTTFPFSVNTKKKQMQDTDLRRIISNMLHFNIKCLIMMLSLTSIIHYPKCFQQSSNSKKSVFYWRQRCVSFCGLSLTSGVTPVRERKEVGNVTEHNLT